VDQKILMLAADLCILLLMMLVLQAYRMQELQGCGGFHPDFKGRSGRPGNVWEGQDPYSQLKRKMNEAERVS
jgi:hypothetical protein